MILIIDTHDKNAKIALSTKEKVRTVEWEGGRELSSTIFIKINEVLADSDVGLQDISGIVVNVGPGSFTGLRIGLSIANTLAYSLNIPIVGVSAKTFEELISLGRQELTGKKRFETPTSPEYGSEPHITSPKDK